MCTLKRLSLDNEAYTAGPLTAQLLEEDIKLITLPSTNDNAYGEIRGYVDARTIKHKLQIPEPFIDIHPEDIIQPATSLAEFVTRPEYREILRPNFKTHRNTMVAGDQSQTLEHSPSKERSTAPITSSTYLDAASQILPVPPRNLPKIGAQLDRMSRSVGLMVQTEAPLLRSLSRFTRTMVHASYCEASNDRTEQQAVSVEDGESGRIGNGHLLNPIQQENKIQKELEEMNKITQGLALELYTLSNEVVEGLQTLQMSVAHKITQRDEVWRDIKRKVNETADEADVDDEEERESQGILERRLGTNGFA